MKSFSKHQYLHTTPFETLLLYVILVVVINTTSAISTIVDTTIAKVSVQRSAT